MTQKVETPGDEIRNLLRNIVSKPELYGDTVSFTHLPSGGFSITPHDDNDIPDTTRVIILDPAQVHGLSARLNMDPERASQIVAQHITETWGADRGIYAGAMMGVFGTVCLIIGIIAGLMF